MQFIKSFENIQRLITTRTWSHTTQLLFKCYNNHSSDKESYCDEDCFTYSDHSSDDREFDNCDEHSLHQCHQVNPEPDKCPPVTETCKEECTGYNKYSFHDFLIQAVAHIETQPSNKEFFEPKGSLDKQIKMEDETKLC